MWNFIDANRGAVFKHIVLETHIIIAKQCATDKYNMRKTTMCLKQSAQCLLYCYNA